MRDEPWGALEPITRSAIHDEVRRIHLLGGDPRLVACLADLLRDAFDRIVPGDVLPVVAARRPVLGGLEPLRRGVRREHGDAFDAQRSAVHDVVVVALHRDQLALADGRDHSAPARAEVAGGGELVDVRELQILRGGPHRGNVDQAVESESGAATESQPQQVSPVDRSRSAWTAFRFTEARGSPSTLTSSEGSSMSFSLSTPTSRTLRPRIRSQSARESESHPGCTPEKLKPL